MSAKPPNTVLVHGSYGVAPDADSGWAESELFYHVTADTTTDPSVAELAARMTIVGLNPITNNEPDADDRAGWHRNTVERETWMKAHAFRLARGWECTRLANWFEDHPQLTRLFGFTDGADGLAQFTASAPSQSRLWEVWNNVFDSVEREFVQEVANSLKVKAVEHNIPLPAEPFEREDRNVSSKRGEQRLVAEKTEEVWKQAKPFVTDTFYLDRASNASIHENAFWEQHAYMGMREDMFAQAGQHSFFIDSGRDRTPSASNHRYQLQKHSVEDVRSMLRNTTRSLLARARHNDEFGREVAVAIDITKGAPWTGEVERDDDGQMTEDYILGYKGAERHFQWATVQVVGSDVPLVLDAVPVHRGFSRGDIVDDLLEHATDMLPNISLCMMDREFDSEAVKDACSRHGVYYLNPARKQQSERATCTALRESGRKVKVEETATLTGSTRKRMYLPARNKELFATDDVDTDADDEPEIRQELMNDFADIGVVDEEDDSGMFSDVLDEMAEGEGPRRGNDEDTEAYALFETDHPNIDTDADSEAELLRSVRGVVRRYSARWGIENGYKKLKKFRVRTTSKDHSYRFFNFAFACVLYNVWRLVDLLVKLAIDGDDAAYTPRVDANQFLTVAKTFYGLDPPD